MKQLLGSVEVPAPVSAADRSDREGGAPILSNPDLVAALDRCYHMGTQWNLALMELVAQAERRNLPAEEGLSSITDWLCARFGLGYNRTSELVEIAIALEELPQLRRAYREGRVSYDHLRALVQVAGPDNEADLLEAAEGLSVAQTFRMVSKIVEVSTEDSVDARQQRWLQMRWDHQSRCLLLFARLPEDQGAIVEKAIDSLARAMPEDTLHEPEKTPMGAKRADALVMLASSALADHRPPSTVVVHVDSEGKGTAELEGGCTVSPETVSRLACDSLVRVVAHSKEGEPKALRGTTRTVPKRLATEIRQAQKTCRWPGCRRRKLVEFHHVVPVSDGGPTVWTNLLLLCPTHHYLVHEGGFKIRGRPPNIWVESPTRTPIRAGPPRLCEETAAAFELEFALAMKSPRGPGP